MNLLLGSPDLGKDTSLEYLVSQGFSREEAEVLHWMRTRRAIGNYFGLGAAALVLFSVRKGYMMRLPLINYKINSRMVVGVGAASLFVGNFLFNYNRRGGNTPLANLYTNNNLIANKHDLVQNFEPFNRKFTKPEVEQMLFNGKLKLYGRKKYVYNPHVHGDDQQAHKARHELFNSGRHVITPEIQRAITHENQHKAASGEVVVLKPFRVSEHLDIHGSKEHIHKFELFSKRHVL